MPRWVLGQVQEELSVEEHMRFSRFEYTNPRYAIKVESTSGSQTTSEDFSCYENPMLSTTANTSDTLADHTQATCAKATQDAGLVHADPQLDKALPLQVDADVCVLNKSLVQMHPSPTSVVSFFDDLPLPAKSKWPTDQPAGSESNEKAQVQVKQ